MKSLRRLQAFQRKSSTAFFLQSWKLIPDVTARVTLFEREFLRLYCSRLLPERPAVSQRRVRLQKCFARFDEQSRVVIEAMLALKHQCREQVGVLAF